MTWLMLGGVICGGYAAWYLVSRLGFAFLAGLSGRELVLDWNNQNDDTILFLPVIGELAIALGLFLLAIHGCAQIPIWISRKGLATKQRLAERREARTAKRKVVDAARTIVRRESP